jgi:hypothetical protein
VFFKKTGCLKTEASSQEGITSQNKTVSPASQDKTSLQGSHDLKGEFLNAAQSSKQISHHLLDIRRGKISLLLICI